jgi:hypothetical protein
MSVERPNNDTFGVSVRQQRFAGASIRASYFARMPSRIKLAMVSESVSADTRPPGLYQV